MSRETFENDMAQNRHSTDTAPLSWLKYGGANPLLVTRGPYGPPPTPHLSELQLTSSQELVQDQATESPPSEPSFFGSSKVTRKSVSEGVNEARTGSNKSDDQLFREFHGRQFNAINSTYHLPADMEEHERLSIQHRSLCLLLGNLYTAEDIVEAILKPNDDYTPMILDLGTGSGAWAIDMATKFSHCKVLGLDIVPPQLGSREVPNNCSFEIQDVNLPLTHLANSFDLVHCRGVEMGIPDWSGFMYNIAQTMRPGALFLASGGTSMCLDEYREPCGVIAEGEPGFRWIQKMFSAMHEAAQYFRGSPWAQHTWDKVAERNPYFSDVSCQQLLLPIGNWLPANSPVDHQNAAELNRYNIINLLKTMKPLFIRRGYPEAIVNHWLEQTSKELQELKLHTFSVWTWMWCRRNEDLWSPSPQDTNSDPR